MTNAYLAPKPGQKSDDAFPPGHPGRHDYDPGSPEAIEWARLHVSPLGERDFPVDHPGAVDTPGHKNNLVWAPGVDPYNPHLEPHTGRTPHQVAGIRALSQVASTLARESPAAQPIDALAVNAALDEKRKLLKKDILTEEEYRDVLEHFHQAVPTEEARAKVAASIQRQHEALAFLTNQRGYTQGTALEILGREGAEAILAERDAPAGA